MPNKNTTKVLMIAYTNYSTDARVRREAETMANSPGYDVSFLALKEDYKPKSYRLEGVNVQELNINKYRGKNKLKYLLSYFRFFIKAFWACNIYHFWDQSDVIHVHNMPNFIIFATIIPKLCGKKIILDIHDSTPETFAAKFIQGKNRILFKILSLEEFISCMFVNKIICVNHVQKQAIVNRGIAPKKITVSMNVPDPKWFNSQISLLDVTHSQKRFNLIYHGTLTKRLGIDLAILAVAKLISKIPEIKFHILGNGDDLSEFVALSHSLGISKAIYFNKKMVPVENLIDELKDMNLGIVANRKNIATELMLPVKMLEYIALGIPVVAPRLKTILYYFNDDMVTYFEPENVDSLANAILKLYLEESKRKDQAKAAKKFLDQYGWEKHKMDLINLYRNL